MPKAETILSRRTMFSSVAALGGAALAADVPIAVVDPILALIAEEERWRNLACDARDIAESITDYDSRGTGDESHRAYAETHRLDAIADELFDRIEATAATTREGALAKLELMDPHADTAELRNSSALGAAGQDRVLGRLPRLRTVCELA